MTKTKVFKRGKFYVVQLQDEQGKYKQVAKFETELDAKLFKRDLIKDREGSLKKVTQLTVIDAWKKYSDTSLIYGINTTPYLRANQRCT